MLSKDEEILSYRSSKIETDFIDVFDFLLKIHQRSEVEKNAGTWAMPEKNIVIAFDGTRVTL